jgi:hypothetical protein
MIRPSEFGELMIEREYTCEKNGVKTPLIVQIDKPRRLESDGPYICCWRMEPEVKLSYACGEDGMQALALASQAIESHLKLSMKRDGHAIYWLDPSLELDLLHNHDLSTRIAVAGIFKRSRDYLRLDAMPADLRRDVEEMLDWGRKLTAEDKSAEQKPAKVKKAEKVKGPSARQLDYLRFLHAYIDLHRRAPSESEIVMHMRVTPPSAHDMLVKLEELGYLARTPGVARSIRILIDPKLLTKKH